MIQTNQVVRLVPVRRYDHGGAVSKERFHRLDILRACSTSKSQRTFRVPDRCIPRCLGRDTFGNEYAGLRGGQS